jgi:hypothetical protein
MHFYLFYENTSDACLHSLKHPALELLTTLTRYGILVSRIRKEKRLIINIRDENRIDIKDKEY